MPQFNSIRRSPENRMNNLPVVPRSDGRFTRRDTVDHLALSQRTKRSAKLSALQAPAQHAKRATTNSYGSCVDVTTQHGDNARTGAAVCETILSAQNVNATNFGRLFARDVDGLMFAQPLYVSNLTFPDGSVRNTVFAATMNNTVYAFDADDPNAAVPLWQTNLGSDVPSHDYAPNYNDLPGFNGILGTPVIDPNSQTLYAVAALRTGTQGHYAYSYTLNALNLLTGKPATGPVTLAANGFDAKQLIQRPGLALAQGAVIIGFGSHEDDRPYNGWLLAYDATTLTSLGAINITPQSQGGAIWQAGQAPAVDAQGLVYCTTGNGFNSNASTEHVESIIKVQVRPTFEIIDWFTPNNWEDLENEDFDLSTGPLLPPGTDFVVAGAKNGHLYGVPTNNMGHISDAPQEFSITSGQIRNNFAYLNGSDGARLYLWPEGEKLRSFAVKNDSVDQDAADVGALSSNYPGGQLTLSSNGTAAGAIVWANMAGSGLSSAGLPAGVLRAFNASDLSQELWNSDMNITRDSLGNFARFAPPTVANGKVYVPTFSDQLLVYGLNPINNTPPPAPTPIIPTGAAPMTAPFAMWWLYLTVLVAWMGRYND